MSYGQPQGVQNDKTRAVVRGSRTEARALPSLSAVPHARCTAIHSLSNRSCTGRYSYANSIVVSGERQATRYPSCLMPICSGVWFFRLISLPLLLRPNPQYDSIILGLVCASKLKVNQIIAEGKAHAARILKAKAGLE